jgi:light-regulated signal transduction histidine kinase (bacteriophytochrome)
MHGATDSSCMRRIVLWLVPAVLIAAYCVIDRTVVRFEQFDLADVVTDAVAAAAPRAEHGGVALEMKAGPALLQGRRDTDCSGCRQPHLECDQVHAAGRSRARRSLVQRHDVVLTVSDSGMGIAADEQTDLFSRFHRRRPPRRERYQGPASGSQS